MDTHLEAVPCLRTLSVRSLSGGDSKDLSGHPDGSLDAKVLSLGTLDKLRADLLEVLDVSAGQGDTDAVKALFLSLESLSLGLGR